MTHPNLRLKNFDYADLFHPDGLHKLDQTFLTYLQERNPDLYQALLAYRANQTWPAIEVSELLIQWAKVLEDFLATLFNIEEAVSISQTLTTSFNPLATFKKYFVLRRARKEVSRAATFPSFQILSEWLEHALSNAPLQSADKEMAIALFGNQLLQNSEQHHAEIEKLVQWCTQALLTEAGKKLTASWTSFKIPQKIDPCNLITLSADANDPLNRATLPDHEFRLRDGFKLTDPRMTAREVQDEVQYCIYCHDHDGDFCSKGFPVKKGEPDLGFKKNALGVTLTGCPLEEKISEMNFLKKDGHTLAALAMVMVDNPMCPATGHRICNDCMKACIYQKQEPVNIPQIETRVLVDVLELPWGVEIYDLLTRWNPLRQTQWVMKPYNGLKVMIAGMGPAGFTLAHHLLLEGFAVVGFDGLKIEPFQTDLLTQPIYRFADLKESLDERLMAGFGGVAEYGITVRWDKNFLKLIYLSLMRKEHFQVFGGVRFGGTITIEDAWAMGFDHFVVAVGAGLPKALTIPGSLAPGMRQANDFLMALQLGNAAKTSSITNLQIRLPAVVIGGGLTGVDTATEIQAYYITQVEKILTRYEILAAHMGEAAILAQLDIASKTILDEYLTHGRAVRAERARAAAAKESPNFIALIRQFGGVTIAYRRSMKESPAYIHNHEELKKALEEGIYYLEGLEPISALLDEQGHVNALVCQQRMRVENQWVTTNAEITLPAHSILVATGTQPNTAYEFEHRGTFNRINLQYQHYEDDAGELKTVEVEHCKTAHFGPFTSYQRDDKRVSLIGDTHPVFHGNVVKAIASGFRAYPKILALFENRLHEIGSETEYAHFAQCMRDAFQAKVTRIDRKTHNTIELTISAPLAAKNFKPGEFYRLQNFETYASRIQNTLLQMDPLALAAAECDRVRGTLTFIVSEQTAAAKLCATLKVNEPVALMGPTGVRAKNPDHPETVLIIGNPSSFAFLRSYGRLLKETGNKVIYLGYFEHTAEIFCQSRLEDCADTILWLTNHKDPLLVRPQDKHLIGNDILQALLTQRELFAEVDRIFLVGGIDLLRTFQAARNTTLKTLFQKDPKVFGSVHGNMQCMLKGVCAQCLQWQIDPLTGQRTKAVFACSWQDQPLEIIDIDHAAARQYQNRLHEQINSLWVDHVLKELPLLS